MNPSVRQHPISAAFVFLICLFAAQSAQSQLTVTRTDDRNATCVSGVDCSLREAVNAANASATNDTINFAIPAGDAGCTAGVCTIRLASELGELTVNPAATAGTLLITNSTGAGNLLIGLASANDGSATNNAAVTMGVLIGDGNGDGLVNSGDSLQTRNRSGQASDLTNFRSDVNTDGFVNSGDTTAVRSRSGTALP